MSTSLSVHNVVRVTRKVTEYPDGTEHSGAYAATTYSFKCKGPLTSNLATIEITVFHPIGLEIEDVDDVWGSTEDVYSRNRL